MSRLNAYVLNQRSCPIKAGDIVRVVATAVSGERGWPHNWADGMSTCVGGEYIVGVSCAYEWYGYFLQGSGYHFPFFVLELVQEGTGSIETFPYKEDL